MFSYCVLSLINTILKLADLEPKFALVLVGSKDTLVMQMAELFFNNFIPSKGFEDACTSKIRECQNRLDLIPISHTLSSSTLEKLYKIKDRAVIIDGIIDGRRKNIKDLYEEDLINYYYNGKINIKSKKQQIVINALPVFVVLKPVDGTVFSCVNFEKNSVKLDKLLSFKKRNSVLSQMAYEFIKWVEKKLEDETKFKKKIYNYYTEKRRDLYHNILKITERESSINAWYLLGFYLYLEFGLEKKYINREKRNELLSNGFKAITGHEFDDVEGYKVFENQKKQIKSDEERKKDAIIETVKYIYKNCNSKLHKGKGKLKEGQIGWICTVSRRIKENSKKKTTKLDILCFAKKDFVEIFNHYIKENKLIDDSIELKKDDYKKYSKEFIDEHIVEVTDGDDRNYFKSSSITKAETRFVAFRIDTLKKLINNDGKNKNLGS